MPDNYKPAELSKEIIKSRMIKNAANFWGYEDADIDSFDPIARMLIEACAIEVYKISSEVGDSNVRMIEKLANLLTPDVMVGPRPSHALLHAIPNDIQYQVFPGFQFIYPKKFASKSNGSVDSSVNIFFSPVSKFNLVSGRVKFIATGSKIFSFPEDNSKDLFLKTIPGKKFDNSTIWVGLQLHNKIDSLNGISFLFDWKNLPDSYSYYQLLPLSKWTINDSALSVTHGMNQNKESSKNEFENDFLAENDATRSFEKQIYDFYNPRFITISSAASGKLSEDSREKYPDIFKELISEKDLPKFTEEIVWIKISFPALFNEFVLDDVFISVNCFPVMNRKLTELRYRLQENVNIIPLTTEDQFMAVKTVTDVEGIEYHSNPVSESKANEPGTYALRKGGITRFDSKSAAEYINYLIELLRDESASFSSFDRDFINTHITSINQNISIIEQKVGQNISDIKNMPAFILLKPRKEGETVYVEYWTTNGEAANQVRSGSKLKLQSNSEIKQDSVMLVTGSNGGKDRLEPNEMLFAYRTAIMTKGRIVTAEDIKFFCRYELGDKITGVEIKKGIDVGLSPNDGLLRTIDVYLTPASSELNAEEWKSICAELLSKLNGKSSTLKNYRIFIAK